MFYSIKESEKLPNKVKESLEKGKLIIGNWKDNKLNSLINDCLNIEKNLIEINKVNLSLTKFNSYQNKIQFIQSENEIKQIFEIIEKFGLIKDETDYEKKNIKELNEEEDVSEEEELSEEGLEKEAIETVMNEGKCSRQVAIRALRAHNGDPVEALLEVGI